jgi:hypothetical protein
LAIAGLNNRNSVALKKAGICNKGRRIANAESHSKTAKLKASNSPLFANHTKTIKLTYREIPVKTIEAA